MFIIVKNKNEEEDIINWNNVTCICKDYQRITTIDDGDVDVYILKISTIDASITIKYDSKEKRDKAFNDISDALKLNIRYVVIFGN